MAGRDPVPSATAPGRRTGAGRWSALPLAAGVLTVLIGVLILVWPGATIVLIAWLFAIQLLVTGVIQLVVAFRGDESTGGRVLLGLLGALSIVVGFLCLWVPLQTALVIGLLIGAMWVVGGVIRIVHALGAAHRGGRGWGVVAGIFSVIGGTIVLVYPGLSIVALLWIFGVVLVVTGLVVVVQAVVAHRHRRPRLGGETGHAATSPG
jgi:uncharacterized membrane protein HdeD (DUF308 family)